ncbi:unnamed protein product [Sphagnum compactum]
MGFLDLPKPLGVFHVAFADFELRTYASDSDVKVGAAAIRRGAVSEVHDDDDVERKECDKEDEETVVGQGSLNVTMLQGRLDMSYLAIWGHSFGVSTAVVVCGLDKRLKCCVAEDTWWQPIEQVHYDRLAGKAPILFLNNEQFEWEELRRLRNVFLKARAEAESDGQPLVTQLITLKDNFELSMGHE